MTIPRWEGEPSESPINNPGNRAIYPIGGHVYIKATGNEGMVMNVREDPRLGILYKVFIPGQMDYIEFREDQLNPDTELWPNTLPWGEEEQQYYRGAKWKLAVDLTNPNYDYSQSLTPDQIVTQCMTCGRFRHADGSWLAENPNLGAQVSHGICPDCWAKMPGVGNTPYPVTGGWKFADSDAIPANYTDEDPYDISGKQPLVENLQTDWYNRDEDQQAQAIANAFRSTMISPQLELKWNAVAYQALTQIPPDVDNPDVYEQYLRNYKQRYDNPGQLGLEGDEGLDPDSVIPGQRMNPPFWKNVRSLGQLAPYIEGLRQAALEDVRGGGEGFLFRGHAMQIPGVGPKVASFAWLLLQPTTSELAAIDVWMMRHLGEPGDSPKSPERYYELEDQLRAERDQLYPGLPLAQYQWAIWDQLRTPGAHQDHTPFRVLEPKPFTNVDWSGQTAVERAQQQRFKPTPVHPEQLALSSWTIAPTWKSVPKWATPWRPLRKTAMGYTIYGMTVGTVGIVQGIAVRPDSQSREEIERLLMSLPTHREDLLKQRQIIPEWAINRGGKVAENFKPTPFGQGLTYAPGVIVVSEWVDVEDNWILYSPNTYGIVAHLGGGNSHGVVVARERNIPIVVGADIHTIQPGDNLRIDGERGIIEVNGGGVDTEEHTPLVASEPIIAWVWSQGNGLHEAIPEGAGGAEALHMPMMMQLKAEGKLDPKDYTLGVIYENGKLETPKMPSDEDALLAWLNAIHPITSIETSG